MTPEIIFEGPIEGTLWRHKKSGGLYVVKEKCRIEATAEPGLLYKSEKTGELWVRPETEFLDGRFVHIPTGAPFHPTLFEDIVAFHQKFGVDYDGPPRELPLELRVFRREFLKEEFREYINAETLHEKLDALVDLVYVALGTARLHGFDFDEAWRRVHQANMSKVRAQKDSDSKRGSAAFDVVKPPNFVPPYLKDLTGEA